MSEGHTSKHFRVKGLRFGIRCLGLGSRSTYPQQYVNNSPKPIITAIKAIILHTFGVQVRFRVSSVRIRESGPAPKASELLGSGGSEV